MEEIKNGKTELWYNIKSEKFEYVTLKELKDKIQILEDVRKKYILGLEESQATLNLKEE